MKKALLEVLLVVALVVMVASIGELAWYFVFQPKFDLLVVAKMIGWAAVLVLSLVGGLAARDRLRED